MGGRKVVIEGSHYCPPGESQVTARDSVPRLRARWLADATPSAHPMPRCASSAGRRGAYTPGLQFALPCFASPRQTADLIRPQPVAHLGLSLEPSTGSLRLLIILPSLVHTYPLLLSSFSKTAPVPLLSCQSYPMPTNHLQLPMPRPFVHPCHSCGARSSLRPST
ncbi:hypothetical protein BD311DRAFT_762669 [Dichomitus squalens]|uniref:Uncharacterized protein n=1 Tax=Dichomitus squalens TaxID=114155 RepID=A0A4Q9MG31_9APHY|nr:hypothetical protein BD311DRAFT_762669 [Dichomitus squalens]